jgi:hypothetical protein
MTQQLTEDLALIARNGIDKLLAITPAAHKALDALDLIAKHEQGVSWRVRKPNGHIVTIYPAKVCEEAAAALRAHL